MKVEIKIPKMGESIVEVGIGSLLKPNGSNVKEGDDIVEIETEKVNQVLNSPASGKIEWSVKQGDSAKVDAVIGTIDTEAKGEEAAAGPEKPKEEKVEEKKPEKPQLQEPKVDLPPVRQTQEHFIKEVSSPAPPQVPKEAAQAPRENSRETRKKVSKLRKVIAERLVEVKNQTAMLTTFNEVDMSQVIAIREEHKEAFLKKHGVKLGFMSFFVKACVSALQKFPDINARLEKDEIVYHHFYDIGIAVGTEKGLFVPVIRNADQLSYAEIEMALKQYADKAKSGTISIDEMKGGTFTITNGGVYGSMLSTPILNPPQSGILGMHNIVKRPVVINDEIVIRPVMYLALSYDHRIVDGKESIAFLMHIKNKLEEPERFLLDL